MAGQRVVKRAHSNCEDEAIKENPVKRFFATKIAVNATGWIDPLKDHLSRRRISSSCKMHISTFYKILSASGSLQILLSPQLFFFLLFQCFFTFDFLPVECATPITTTATPFKLKLPWKYWKSIESVSVCFWIFHARFILWPADGLSTWRRTKSRPNWAAERITLLFHHIHRVLTDVAMFPLFHFTTHCLKVCQQWNDDENDLLQSGNLKS